MDEGHGGEWFWCLRHRHPEPADQACEAEQRLGPYPSEEEARAWKDRVESRNEEWDSEDRRWEGD
jgi:hypothetical protein